MQKKYLKMGYETHRSLVLSQLLILAKQKAITFSDYIPLAFALSHRIYPYFIDSHFPYDTFAGQDVYEIDKNLVDHAIKRLLTPAFTTYTNDQSLPSFKGLANQLHTFDNQKQDVTFYEDYLLKIVQYCFLSLRFEDMIKDMSKDSTQFSHRKYFCIPFTIKDISPFF